MIAPIKACLGRLWADSVVVEELGVGYGVADVVAARPCADGVRQRLRQHQTTTLPRRADVQVVRALRQLDEATFDLLVELTGISARRLRYDVLRFLLAENFIERIANDTFQLLGEYRPVTEEIWAVEAKMKNWFEGLCQAKRYQHFAHKTYLAIAAPNRDLVRDEFLREQNVGLIAVSQDAADIVFHQRRRKPRSEELFLMTNERIWQQIHARA
jgi:hypothetical protein